MKPRVTPIGNLFDLVQNGVCTPKDVATYSVGDWVWAKHRGKNERRFLARIESAKPIHTVAGDTWPVRIYRAGRGWQTFVEHRPIVGPLNPAEVAHNRKLGLIPPAGQALP